jgi:hypothetical protein
MVPFLIVIERNVSFLKFTFKTYLMNAIDFNKHDIDIFINDTWQKYAGNYSKLQGDFFVRIAL